MKETDMKKMKKFTLGDLIAALFEEALKVSSSPVEQKVMVYAALKDLLAKQVNSKHPIALQI
jgi:hypothetical protein